MRFPPLKTTLFDYTPLRTIRIGRIFELSFELAIIMTVVSRTRIRLNGTGKECGRCDYCSFDAFIFWNQIENDEVFDFKYHGVEFLNYKKM